MEGFEGRSLIDLSAPSSPSWAGVALILMVFGIYKFFSLNRYENDYRGWLGVAYFFFILPMLTIGAGYLYGLILIVIITVNYLYIANSDKKRLSTFNTRETLTENKVSKGSTDPSVPFCKEVDKKNVIASKLHNYAAVLRNKKDTNDFRYYSFSKANYLVDSSLAGLLDDNENLNDWDLRYIKVDSNYESLIKEAELEFDDFLDPTILPEVAYCTIYHLVKEKEEGKITEERLREIIKRRRKVFARE